jgi:hypothetical protein
MAIKEEKGGWIGRYNLGHSRPAGKQHINKYAFNDMIVLARI